MERSSLTPPYKIRKLFCRCFNWMLQSSPWWWLMIQSKHWQKREEHKGDHTVNGKEGSLIPTYIRSHQPHIHTRHPHDTHTIDTHTHAPCTHTHNTHTSTWHPHDRHTHTHMHTPHVTHTHATCIHIHTHTHAHTRHTHHTSHTHAHMRDTHTHTCHTHTHATCIYIHTHTHIHAYTHTRHVHTTHDTHTTHTCMHTHTCSHLYYVDGFDIKRISADGDGDQQLVYFEFDAFENEIKGLAVDTVSNFLYWTVGSDIKYLNMTHWEAQQGNIDPTTVSKGFDGAVPHGISVINSTIYWTEDRKVDQENPQITRPGAIYSFSLPTSTAQRLLQDNTLSPQGLCTFVNISSMFNYNCMRTCGVAQSPLYIQLLILHEFGVWGLMLEDHGYNTKVHFKS